jgi:hypothetical protein
MRRIELVEAFGGAVLVRFFDRAQNEVGFGAVRAEEFKDSAFQQRLMQVSYLWMQANASDIYIRKACAQMNAGTFAKTEVTP